MKQILIGVSGAVIGAGAMIALLWWYFKDVFR